MAEIIQAQIESLLKDKIGWSASILGSKEISRAVEKRMIAGNFPHLQTYLQQLQISPPEIDALIELLIVPETWFFRDWEPFVFLEHYIRSEWLLKQSYRRLRVLSVPCSSGEEPYSIAMSLLNSGLMSNQFQIDAVDISKISLNKAREAVYSQNSFRVKNLEFQSRYFTKSDNRYHLQDSVKNAVNFIQGNLVDRNFLRDKNPYDIIFCRNVLIYFDDLARVKAMETLNGLLRNEGLLFLGHAEKGQLLDSSFVSIKHPFAFAYRKIEKNNYQLNFSTCLEKKTKLPQLSEKSIGVTKQNQVIVNQENQNSVAVFGGESTTSNQETIKTKASIQQESSYLEKARKLADSGQLNEAANICETYLKKNSVCVEAYILLGEVYQGKGMEKQAEQCFQKAIYLAPNNYDALLHLTLLTEHRGDTAKAAVLRQRIQRLEKS
ncbi:CheR family methyltransferase [Kamptonema sp. UHCC 0994]|uniref:CheR family methyltransferase n=1 Tax=Kamptonema sp. UHCC 0994 TaxID=3031329 RepID=UPI0023BA2A88|nr:CheR family methyltransferase [Kamptonema sp. UHCC 0994]MDF0553815.1 tetratricopeptide repeat protein [Kamptonema sp. UHCC 0994]